MAATHERARDPAAVRERLGLTRTALEHAAYAHLDAAPHLRRGVTKALAMHLADAVWSGIDRHLFRDARGNRHGPLHIGRWCDFTRLPGRARSHTTPNKWETFRLHGSLAGHRVAYTDHDGDFVQPRRLRAVHSDAWWSYVGPLAMVFTGLAGGSESTDLSARDGSFVASRMSTPGSVRVARRNVGTALSATLNETGVRQTTSERARMRTDRSTKYASLWTYLRDNS